MAEPFASGLSTPPEKSETSFLTSMEFVIQLKKSTLGGEAMRGRAVVVGLVLSFFGRARELHCLTNSDDKRNSMVKSHRLCFGRRRACVENFFV